MDGILGIKQTQSQRFLENGKRVPVTAIFVEDNAVIAVKDTTTHGYSAIQLGIGMKKKPSKALLGHVAKAQLPHVPSYIRELRSEAAIDTSFTPGMMIAVETVLQPGDSVQVTGISKGKGFAGVVKRHHFRGGPRTHGQSNRERHPGSIGQTTTPGRVYKGKRMAGRMGHEIVTVKNMTIVSVDATSKIILVDGLIPGSTNTQVIVKKIGTDKKYVPLQLTVEELDIKQKADAEATRIAEEDAKKAEMEAAKQAEIEAKAAAETPVVESNSIDNVESEVAPEAPVIEETPVEESKEEASSK